jgi:hypothetical protein
MVAPQSTSFHQADCPGFDLHIEQIQAVGFNVFSKLSPFYICGWGRLMTGRWSVVPHSHAGAWERSRFSWINSCWEKGTVLFFFEYRGAGLDAGNSNKPVFGGLFPCSSVGTPLGRSRVLDYPRASPNRGHVKRGLCPKYSGLELLVEKQKVKGSQLGKGRFSEGDAPGETLLRLSRQPSRRCQCQLAAITGASVVW